MEHFWMQFFIFVWTHIIEDCLYEKIELQHQARLGTEGKNKSTLCKENWNWQSLRSLTLRGNLLNTGRKCAVMDNALHLK